MYIFQDFRARKIPKSEVITGIIFDKGMSAVYYFRLSSWCYNHHLKILAKILHHMNIFFNHCEIDYHSTIGKGFCIYHALGLVIAKCTIGENFTICHNCTVGRGQTPDENGIDTPIIGDNVTVFPGAVVAGNIKIGDNCKIGANVVVVKDLPPNSSVRFPEPVASIRQTK